MHCCKIMLRECSCGALGSVLTLDECSWSVFASIQQLCEGVFFGLSCMQRIRLGFERRWFLVREIRFLGFSCICWARIWFARFVGSSESAPSGIQYLSICVHPLDSFCVLILREFFLSIVDSHASCIRLALFLFRVFVVGRRFRTKQSRKTPWCCLCFSVIVLSSSVLVKNCSELNGCTKRLTFEKPLCRMRLWRVRWMHGNR